MDDAKVCTLRDRAQRALDLTNQAHRSQRRHVAANANRDQAGVAFRKLRSPAMPHPRSRRSLTPGTFPRPTPAHRHPEVQLELGSTLHTLDCGYVLVGSQGNFRIFLKKHDALVGHGCARPASPRPRASEGLGGPETIAGAIGSPARWRRGASSTRQPHDRSAPPPCDASRDRAGNPNGARLPSPGPPLPPQNLLQPRWNGSHTRNSTLLALIRDCGLSEGGGGGWATAK